LLFRLPASVVMAGLEPAIHGAPLRLSLAATILRRVVSGLRKCARVLVDGRDEPGHDGRLTTVQTAVAISAKRVVRKSRRRRASPIGISTNSQSIRRSASEPRLGAPNCLFARQDSVRA